MSKFILASNSPRRRELLKQVIEEYEVITSNIEEVIDEELPYEEAVMDLAFQKASDIFRTHKEDTVLGFDTLVLIDDELLGKPKDKEDAKGMLKKLSGKTHFVITGAAIISKKVSTSFYVKTRVNFAEMSEEEIDNYILTNEPMDKAGAYAIQGKGSKFVVSVTGDYFTVMGLPVQRLYQELKKYDLI
ncbi:MAG: nucleoside triphosphate pyrophosphatase [Candidatus Izemoplasmatales bacterium]